MKGTRTNARRAVMEERVRIPGNCTMSGRHDVSVMGIQAGAARRILKTAAGKSRLMCLLKLNRVQPLEPVAELQRLLGSMASTASLWSTPACGSSAQRPRRYVSSQPALPSSGARPDGPNWLPRLFGLGVAGMLLGTPPGPPRAPLSASATSLSLGSVEQHPFCSARQPACYPNDRASSISRSRRNSSLRLAPVLSSPQSRTRST